MNSGTFIKTYDVIGKTDSRKKEMSHASEAWKPLNKVSCRWKTKKLRPVGALFEENKIWGHKENCAAAKLSDC